ARARHAQRLVRGRRALQQQLPHRDVVAVLQRTVRAHGQALPLGQLVQHHFLGAVVRNDGDLPVPVGLLDADPAVALGDRRLALRGPRLEQLLDTRQTGGDVVTGDATLVERTHGQLRTRLTDRLGGDDTDGLADVHQLAGGHRAAVAHRAHAHGRLAGQHAAHLDLGDAQAEQLLDLRVTQVVTAVDHHVAVRVRGVLGQVAGVHRRGHVLGRDDLAVGGLVPDGHLDAAVGATVRLAHDDVLRDVHQTPGQVTRVGGTQRRVGQTLPSTVGGDEVLRHRQALTEVRLERARDVLTLRVGHQTTHTGQRPHLGHVARRTRLHDHRDRVVL